MTHNTQGLDEATVNGVYQTVGYLAIKGMPLTDTQLVAARLLIKQLEELKDES
jgi:hypothetical protein